MKCILHYEEDKFPPLLKMFIYGCPHYRQDKETFQHFRKCINKAADKINMFYPINEPIDLYVVFIDPTSPDLANCLMALYRAVDAKALKGKSLLTDDGLFSKVTMMKFYPNDRIKAENRVP